LAVRTCSLVSADREALKLLIETVNSVDVLLSALGSLRQSTSSPDR
jgi:hypothetical protein